MLDVIAATKSSLAELAADFEPAALTRQQAMRALDDLGAIRRLVEGLLAEVAKRVADAGGDEKGGTRDAAQHYARAVGGDASEARRSMATAKRLEKLPATRAAVRAGELSARQAQMVAEAAEHNPGAEHELLAAAAEGMVPLRDACVAARARVENEDARAARQHAARGLRMWTASDGMVEGRFRLAPEVGGRLKAAIDAGTQRIFRSRRTAGPHEHHEAYAADALVDLVFAEGDKRPRTGTTVHVVIDHAALVRGNAADGETCVIPGVGPVSVAWVRDLLGEAFVTAVVKKGHDITTVAHFGRHIPAELRTAMIVGGRECDIVGCHARGYLEIDHCEVDVAKGGPTAWWNLGWLCSVDHDRKTRGWKLGPRDPNTAKRTLDPPGPTPAPP
jgi:hypothetical protein